MIRFLAVFFTLFFIGVPLASAQFSSDAWPYMRYIQYGPSDNIQKVGVKLDNQLLTQVFEDFRDVRLIDDAGDEISYAIHGEVQKDMAKIGTLTQVLFDDVLVKETLQTIGNLTDDMRNSYVEFSKDVDKVSFVFELPEASIIDKVNSFTYDQSNTWTDVLVEASNDKKDWKMLRSKVDLDHQTWRWFGFPRYETPYKYYKISFWGTGTMKIHELSLLTQNDAEIVFESEPGATYALYYGNGGAASPEYSQKDVSPEISVGLAEQQRNTSWNQDIDGDGVVSRADTCPFIKNKDQKDSDTDGIGDACELKDGLKTSSDIQKEGKSEKVPEILSPSNESTKAPSIREKPEEPVVDTSKPGTSLSTTVIYVFVALIIGIILGLSFHTGGSKKVEKTKNKK